MFGDLKEDKAAYVRAMFAAIADRYDPINSLLSVGRDGAWRRFAASKCRISPGELVLDVATGTGELARHLSRRNHGSTIIGVDFCPGMLLKARAKFVSSSNSNTIVLVLGDVLRLPFPDSAFDCVTIGFALRNVADVEVAFCEMARVVKPGGRVVSLDLTRPSCLPIRELHKFVLSRIVSFVGGIVSSSKEAYTYLPDSIIEFLSPDEVGRIMEKAGLHEVGIYRLTLGVATVHVATRGA